MINDWKAKFQVAQGKNFSKYPEAALPLLRSESFRIYVELSLLRILFSIYGQDPS